MSRYGYALLMGAVIAANRPASGAEFKLMADKKPACSIVLSDEAGPVERHAADELASYLAKLSGGTAPGIGAEAAPGLYPIRFALVEEAAIRDDGFRLKADPDGLEIAARAPRGLLYGAYEVLKRYGGVRWLAPGEDGEYFTPKPTLSVPAGETVVNPSFAHRTIELVSANVNSPAWDTFDWMVRNNLWIHRSSGVINNKSLKAGLEARAAVAMDGGHCFTDLLAGNRLDGKTWAEFKEKLNRLFEEHPELFPLSNQRRVMLGDHKHQPCTSNPETIRLMSDHLARMIKEVTGPDGSFVIMNDDGTGWCQCERCKALDSERDRENHYVVTRYWTLVNAMAGKTLAESPEADLIGFAYQNYQAAPERLKPDKRLKVQLCYNRICYRHNIDDPDCLTNTRYDRHFKAWSRIGNRLVSREQIPIVAGRHFMPVEDQYVHLFRYYRDLGITGTTCEMCPIDGMYREDRKALSEHPPWLTAWQLMFLHAALLWDVDRDYDALYEEINALYYGKAAWDGGMREFRRLLRRASNETPGCYGHGHASPLGRALDRPGVHEKLLEHIAAAEKAAERDPDPRALKHVRYDRESFSRTWEVFRKDYLANYREIRAYKKTAPIAIDGALEEPDWKNADTVSGFKTQAMTGSRDADPQTYVRIVYEPDNLYFAIEALEPEPDKLVSNVKERDGEVWRDNTLELFLNHPDLGSSYYQIIVNADGVLFDHRVVPGRGSDRTFDSGAEVKTAVLGDRWILEARIPTAPLGEACRDGQMWKINVLRSRKLTDGTDQASTWSHGTGHSVELFHPVVFSGSRAVQKASLMEYDTHQWENGSFSAVDKLDKVPAGWSVKDGLAPSHWNLASAGGSLEMIRQQAGADDYYVRLRRGFIFQLHGDRWKEPSSTRYKINFRAYGDGVMDVLALLYTISPYSCFRTDSVKTLALASPDWEYFSLDYEKDETHVMPALAFRCNSGEVNIDDVSFVALN